MSGAKRTGGSNWRGAAVSRPASKNPAKIALLLLFTGLVALFAAFVWLALRPHERTHLLIVQTGVSDQFSAPPLVLEEESAQRLIDATGALWVVEGGPNRIKLQDVLADMGRLKVDDRDTVVLYISANVVASPGSGKSGGADAEPFLLTQSYDVGNPTNDRVSVSEVLKCLSGKRASCKLLVLDGGRFGPSARNGVLFNSFASAVERLVQEQGDPDLYAMTVCSDLESAGLGIGEGASPLATALSRAAKTPTLLEDANASDASSVTIQELSAYVLATLGRDSGGYQTPRVFHKTLSTNQIVSAVESPVIAWRRPASDAPVAPSEDDEKAAVTPAVDEKEDEPLVADASDDNPAPGGVAKAEAAAPGGDAAAAVDKAAVVGDAPGSAASKGGEAQAASAAADVRVKIDEAWSRFESLYDFGDAGSPSAYRIQDWRLEGATLLQFDLLTRGGTDPKGFQKEISAAAENLKTLSADGVRDRQTLDGREGLPAKVVSAIEALSKLTAIAAELVRYDAVAVTAKRGDNSLEEFQRQVRDLLTAIAGAQKMYTQLCDQPLSDWNDAPEFLERVDRARSSALTARRWVDTEFNAARELITADVVADFAARRRLETLLQSTLLQSRQRRDAWQTLASAKLPEPITPEEVDRYFQLTPPQPESDAVLAHARLEAALASLASPERSWSDATSLTEVHQLGAELRDFYEQLPGRLSGDTDKAPLRNAGFAVLDQYDAIDTDFSDSFRLGVTPPETLQLSLESPPTQRLVVKKPLKFSWKINANLREPGSVRLEFEDPNGGLKNGLIDVYRRDDNKPLRSGDSWTEDVARGKSSLSVSLYVVANRNWDGSSERLFPLMLRATSDGLRSDASSDAILPDAARIVLSAACLEPDLPPEEANEGGALQLRLFPNRSTDFAVSLRNDTDEEESVTVELYSVPQLSGVTWSPGLLVSESTGVAFSAYQDWAKSGNRKLVAKTSAPMVLPPKGKALRVPFIRGAASEGDKKEEGAAAEPAPPPPDDVSQGLLCVVTRQSGKPLHYWIEVRPRHPSEYLEFEARVDSANSGAGRDRAVLVRAELIDMNGDGRLDSPPGSAKKPVLMTLAKDCLLFADLPAMSQSIVGSKVEIPRNIVPGGGNLDGRSPRLRVAVDGYPRALVAEVSERMGSIRPDDPLDRQRIALGSVEMQGLKYQLSALQEPPAEPPAPEEAAGKPSEQSLACDPTAPCVFDVRDGGKPLRIVLNVDAPADAFNEDQSNQELSAKDYVRVALLGRRNDREGALVETRSFADRKVQVTLDGVDPTGALRLTSVVGDVEITLDPQSGSEEKRKLLAELYFNGRRESYDERDVLFDVAPPKIEHVKLPPSVKFGTKSVDAEIVVRDLSGIKLVEAWLTATKGFPKEQPATFSKAVLPKVGSQREDIYLPPPPEPGKLHYVYFRVTDACGKLSKVTGGYPLLLKPKPAPPPKAPPIPPDLRGFVQLDSRAGISLTVSLAEKPAKTAVSQRDGSFVIPQVPEGTYTIVARGTFNNTNYVGSAEVILEKPEDYVGQIVTVAVDKPSD